MEENNFRKRQRTFSNETIFELLDLSDVEDSTNEISKNMENLKIDKKIDTLLEEMNIKIENLFEAMNVKIDNLSTTWESSSSSVSLIFVKLMFFF